MGTFGMDTGAVHTAGGNVQKQAEEFGYNHRKISEIVKGITASEYTSTDAQAIARSIENYDPLLNQVQAKLEGHGNYGVHASNKTTAVNDEIKSNIAAKL